MATAEELIGGAAERMAKSVEHARAEVATGRTGRASAIDGRTTRHDDYGLSIKHRKCREEAFGWAKTAGGMAQTVRRDG